MINNTSINNDSINNYSVNNGSVKGSSINNYSVDDDLVNDASVDDASVDDVSVNNALVNRNTTLVSELYSPPSLSRILSSHTTSSEGTVVMPTTLTGSHLEQQQSLPNIPTRPSGTSIADHPQKRQNPPKPSAFGIVSPEQPIINAQHNLSAKEDQHGPLPEGWETGTDSFGLTYYANRHTGGITRNRPSPNPVVDHQVQEGETTLTSLGSLPVGWEERQTTDGFPSGQGILTSILRGRPQGISQIHTHTPPDIDRDTRSETSPVIDTRSEVSSDIGTRSDTWAGPRDSLSVLGIKSSHPRTRKGLRLPKLRVSGRSPSPGIEKMTFVPITESSIFLEEAFNEGEGTTSGGGFNANGLR